MLLVLVLVLVLVLLLLLLLLVQFPEENVFFFLSKVTVKIQYHKNVIPPCQIKNNPQKIKNRHFKFSLFSTFPLFSFISLPLCSFWKMAAEENMPPLEEGFLPPPQPIVDYENKTYLAPMVRVGTLPFRLMSMKYGADCCFVEELIDRSISSCERKENHLLNTIDFVRKQKVVFRTSVEDRPNIFQMGTADPVHALKAAEMISRDVCGIDINMGFVCLFFFFFFFFFFFLCFFFFFFFSFLFFLFDS